MTAATQTGAAGFLARFATLRDTLPGDPAVREATAEAFRAAGLPGGTPGRRPEAWKFTSLRPVADARFQSRAASSLGTLGQRLPRINAPRLVFVNGAYDAELSGPPAGFARFADMPDFGTLTWPDREPAVALNTMLAEDGAELTIPAGTDAGLVQLVSLGDGATSFHPRHTLRLEPNARLTLLEIALGEGAYLHNPVTQVYLAEGAVLTHVRLHDESPAAFHLATIYADIGPGATYDSFSLVLGGRVTRTEIHAKLAGFGGAAHLNAAQLLSGMQHADFTSVVRHAAPSCASRQTVKNVLAGRSHGVFQGRIEVARIAQKTDGYQMNQALLLSPEAEVNTKPELEIFADDVKCSHGATVGELDHDQMFYLRSRGIPETEARSILVRAFLEEALEAVTDDTARALLEDNVAGWWERQAA